MLEELIDMWYERKKNMTNCKNRSLVPKKELREKIAIELEHKRPMLKTVQTVTNYKYKVSNIYFNEYSRILHNVQDSHIMCFSCIDSL